MRSDESDRELARLFSEQRLADEASAPALSELLGRSKGRRTPRKAGLGRVALAAAAVAAATAGVLLLRPAHHQDAAELPPAASQLANWKAPTDALLQTPGSELWTRVPVLISRNAPAVEPAHPAQTTKGVGE